MTRSKNNGPAPDPDRVAWGSFRRGIVRCYPALCGERDTYLEGRLLWVSSYTIGIELLDGARVIVNKAYIAFTELRQPAQVCDGESERDTNGITGVTAP